MSIRTTTGTTSALFRCLNCEQVFEFHATAKALAKRHARFMRHKVVGEVAVSWAFDGRMLAAPKGGEETS